MTEEMTPKELDHVESLQGEVRISLVAYHQLIRESTESKLTRSAYEDAVIAIQEYLTFLRSKDGIDFNNLMEEFNKGNPNLTMYVDERGKVRVNLNLTSK